MPKTPDEQAVLEAIQRNPWLDNLVTYYLRCDEAQEMLAAEERKELEK